MESKFKGMYKKGIDQDECKARRETTTLALRKEKKEEGMAKRRNLMVDNFMEKPVEIATPGVSNPVDASKQVYTINDIPALLQGLKSNDVAVQVVSMRGFRRLLSCERNPPVQQCIDHGAVPYFVTCLQRHDCTDLQFEAAWALTNIASTERTRLIVDCGAVPFLAQLLTSPVPDIREQCAWCLGNVAGDGPELRNVVLNSGALQPLVLNVAQPASVSLLRNCTWALSNFCRGKPQPALQVVSPALPVLVNILNQNVDQEATIDATWALSYISDGDNQRIEEVVKLGVIPKLVQMMGSGKPQLVVPALRTLGNIVSGNDSQTQAVVNGNVLPTLVPLLSHSKKNIRKESCWMLSNIAAGNQDQLKQLMNTPDLITRVLVQLSSSAEWDVRREAAWVVSNIATSGSKENIMKLVEYGAIQPICELLDVGEVKMVLLAIESIQAILSAGLDNEKIVQLIDEAEGIEKLETLQQHENTEIYEKVVKIIERYFNGEDAPDSENIKPSFDSQSYSFGFPGVTGKAATDFGVGFMQQSAMTNQFNFNPPPFNTAAFGTNSFNNGF